MNIGILGSGDVGQALSFGFLQHGHTVKIGSRTPDSSALAEWQAKAGSQASTGELAEVAAWAELIVLATAWSGTENALNLAGAENTVGKIVIDVTNPLIFEEGKEPRLERGFSDSGSEQIQRWLPKAKVVKAFNIVNNAFMVHPDFPGGPPDMFICGDDATAREVVFKICQEFGWITTDLGELKEARLLEPLCMLWTTYGLRTGTWNHAFKLLHLPE